jgi:hypothetical protein
MVVHLQGQLQIALFHQKARLFHCCALLLVTPLCPFNVVSSFDILFGDIADHIEALILDERFGLRHIN